jgi:peroxiredoxin
MTIPTSPQETTPLQAGAKTPMILLNDEQGRSVNVNATLREKPAVLIFYRGGWCPYCNLQMSSLRTVEEEFYNLGFNIFGIRPEKLAASREKHGFRYVLLSDSFMGVCTAFGLAYKVPDDEVIMLRDKFNSDLEGDSGQKHHLLPVPAVYLVDDKGVFGFQYSNPDFTVRMDSQELLHIAKRYRAKK